jgi:hypothetical protein
MKRRLQAIVQRFEALSPRDRLSLAAGVLALLVGLEVMVVMPLHDKRRLIETSAVGDASLQSDAQAATQAQRLAQMAALDARGAQIGQQLASLGLHKVSAHSPAGFIVGALQGSKASLVSLRGLPVQELPATATAAMAEAAASDTSGAPVFFRHRAEIRLQGSVTELTQAIEVLEQGAAPLRIEQVLISSADSGPALQATVVLTAINQERTWFAL